MVHVTYVTRFSTKFFGATKKFFSLLVPHSFAHHISQVGGKLTSFRTTEPILSHYYQNLSFFLSVCVVPFVGNTNHGLFGTD
jgi:hypothetical protein